MEWLWCALPPGFLLSIGSVVYLLRSGVQTARRHQPREVHWSHFIGMHGG